MHLRNGPVGSTLIPLWQPLQRLHLVSTGGCSYVFIQINIEVPDWSVIIVSGGWEGRLEGGLMMIREKRGLVTPLSTGQSRGLRHENIFVWDSGLWTWGANFKVSKGWRMGNNQKFFFFFINVLYFPSPTLLFHSYPIWLSHHFLSPSLSKTHEKSHLSSLSLLLHLQPLHSTLDTSPEHSIRIHQCCQ